MDATRILFSYRHEVAGNQILHRLRQFVDLKVDIPDRSIVDVSSYCEKYPYDLVIIEAAILRNINARAEDMLLHALNGKSVVVVHLDDDPLSVNAEQPITPMPGLSGHLNMLHHDCFDGYRFEAFQSALRMQLDRQLRRYIKHMRREQRRRNRQTVLPHFEVVTQRYAYR